MRVSRIKVFQAPGFEYGDGPELSELSPGINVIIGANGSGKSTLCKALQLTLWPELLSGSDYFQIESNWIAGDQTIDLSFRGTSAQRSTEMPKLPATRLASCYTIGLADLLTDDSGELLAAEISRLLSGGYDFQSLLSDQRFQFSTRKANRLLKEYQQTLESQRVCKSQLESISTELKKLPELRAELDSLNRSSSCARYIEVLIELRKTQEERRFLEKQISNIPKTAAVVQKNQLEIYDRLLQAIADTRAQISALEIEKVQKQTSITNAAIGDTVAWKQVIIDAKVLLQKLSSQETQERSLQDSFKKLDAQLVSLKRAAPFLNLERAEVLEQDSLRTLTQSINRAWRLELERQLLQERRDFLQSECEKLPDESENDLSYTLELLYRWCAEPTSKSNSPALVVSLTALLISALVVAALQYHPAFWLGLIPGLYLILLFLKHSNRQDQNARLQLEALILEQTQKQDFSFTLPEVQDWMKQLQKALHSSVQLHRLKEQISECEYKISELDQNIDELLQNFSALDQLFVDGRQLETNFRVLFVQTFEKYLSTLVDRSAVSAQLAQNRQETSELLADFAEQSPVANLQEVQSAAALQSHIIEVEQELQNFQALQNDLSQIERDCERYAEELGKSEQTLENMRKRLQLSEDDPRADLAQLLAHKEQLEDLEKQIFSVQRTEAALKDELNQFPQDIQQEFSEIESPDLLSKLESLRADFERRDKIITEISQIEERERATRENFALEKILHEADTQLEDLKDQKDRALRAAISKFLIEYIQEQHEEQNLPAVFLQAKNFFNRFTHGRYELIAPEQAENNARFRARETSSGKLLQLDQLSSGTRTQLLIAARAAFALESEFDTSLPLIFDEALSSSDPLRFEAIVNCLIELAKDGRQILYFSCQPQDGLAWQEVLAKNNFSDLKLSYLDRYSAQSVDFEHSLFKKGLVADATAKPVQQESYQEYVNRVGVPALPATPLLGAVHLAYLLDDKELLYRLLSVGIDTVGEYRAVRARAATDLPLSASERENLDQRISVLQEVIDVLRIGRGKALSPQVLTDLSNSTYLEKMIELAEREGWDSNKFIERLNPVHKEIKGFRKSSYEQLYAELEARGFLSSTSPLERSEARAIVLTRVKSQNGKKLIEQAQVDHIFSTLWDKYRQEHQNA